MASGIDDRVHRGDSELLDVDQQEVDADVSVLPGLGPSNSDLAARARLARAARAARHPGEDEQETERGELGHEFAADLPPPALPGGGQKALTTAGDPVAGGPPSAAADDDDPEDESEGEPDAWSSVLAAHEPPDAQSVAEIASVPSWLGPRRDQS
jgi:hypothetical protein